MLPQSLIDIYKSGIIIDDENSQRKFDYTVSIDEAEILSRIVKDNQALITLETGLAFGASALAICAAKKEIGGSIKMHYGIDPNQSHEYKNAAVKSIEREGLLSEFKLLEGPSHLMIPELIEKKVTLDFAFIDGWHTFDYTLIDFFLIDKLLKPGGFVAFHDMYAPSKQKVLSYILTHRKYRIEPKYLVKGNESRWRTLKFFIWRILTYPILLFSPYHWKFQLFNSSGLLVLKKLEDFEPNFDFYKSF